MGIIINLKLINSKTILKDDQDIFSDIAERRNYIMSDLQNTFNSFLEKSDNFKDQTLFPDQSGVCMGNNNRFTYRSTVVAINLT